MLVVESLDTRFERSIKHGNISNILTVMTFGNENVQSIGRRIAQMVELTANVQDPGSNQTREHARVISSVSPFHIYRSNTGTGCPKHSLKINMYIYSP